jgi:carbon-monoxide dehydrogenase medium subunit
VTALVRARTVDEALQGLADGEGHALAGGQALTILMKEGFVDAARLVDLSRVESLRGVRRDAEHVEIGAMCSHQLLARDATLAAAAPGLGDAFGSIGNVRVRIAGTIGGNLAHADPRQDPPPALVVLDAVARIASPSGRREVAVADLIDGALSTILAPDELITSVRVPVLDQQEWLGFSKFLAGSAEGFATANVALRARIASDGTIERADMCVGAVGPVPQRIPLVPAVRFADHGSADVAELAQLADAVAAVVAEAVEPTAGHRTSTDYTRALCGELARDLFVRFADRPHDRSAT